MVAPVTSTQSSTNSLVAPEQVSSVVRAPLTEDTSGLSRCVARFVPSTGWARRYPRQHFRGDVTAGVTVAVMLIPQGMAYAILAGLPPITGLYAAIVGIIAYAIFGTSGSLAVGPVAITSLLTLSGLQSIVGTNTAQYPAVAALLALAVGAILLLAGFLRLGFVVNFLSHPVISGFTSAAAITIAVSQFKDLLGVDIGRPDGVVDTLSSLGSALSEINTPTIAISAISVVVLILGKKFVPKAPTALIVLIGATVMTWQFSLADQGVAVLGAVPGGLPTPSMPDMNATLLQDIAPVAFTIAVIAYAEGVSVAKAIARRTRDRIDANQELIANGAANMASGIFGGFPIAGGFSRTAVNHAAGARTPLASLITASMIAITVLWFTPLLQHLPKAVLAAIVVVAVAGLVDIREAANTFNSHRMDFASLAVTFIATLFISVEAGLGIGLIVSLLLFVHRSSTPHITELGRVEGTDEYRNINRWPTYTCEEIALLRMDGPLFFANTKALETAVANLISERPALRTVIIDASAIADIDSSGMHLLQELDNDLMASEITLHLATVRGPVRDVLQRTNLWERLESRVHPSVAAAIATVDSNSKLLACTPEEHPTRVL